MRILYERHVPPKYVRALEGEDWASCIGAADLFHPAAADATIAKYAADHGLVVLTRDRDFFDVNAELGVGVLYLDMARDPPPRDVTLAIERIEETHRDYTDITYSIPGEWV
jgi:predicted nuclease of predicted toxin-antitoxin system